MPPFIDVKKSEKKQKHHSATNEVLHHKTTEQVAGWLIGTIIKNSVYTVPAAGSKRSP